MQNLISLFFITHWPTDSSISPPFNISFTSSMIYPPSAKGTLCTASHTGGLYPVINLWNTSLTSLLPAYRHSLQINHVNLATIFSKPLSYPLENPINWPAFPFSHSNTDPTRAQHSSISSAWLSTLLTTELLIPIVQVYLLHSEAMPKFDEILDWQLTRWCRQQ